MLPSLKQLRNKSKTFQICFSVLFLFRFTCAPASEIKLKPIGFVSVLFQFHFTCASGQEIRSVERDICPVAELG